MENNPENLNEPRIDAGVYSDAPAQPDVEEPRDEKSEEVPEPSNPEQPTEGGTRSESDASEAGDRDQDKAVGSSDVDLRALFSQKDRAGQANAKAGQKTAAIPSTGELSAPTFLAFDLLGLALLLLLVWKFFPDTKKE